MGSLKDVLVPDIGDFKDIPVIEVMVKPGDTVKPEDSLITLESDKATMDVPSPAAGVVKTVKLKVGDKVSEGSMVLSMETADSTEAAPAQSAPAAAPPTAAEKPEPTKAEQPKAEPSRSEAPKADTSRAPAAATIDERGFAAAHASPGVRRFARELGVDLGKVKGSGPKDRVLKEDIQAFVKKAMTGAAAPASGGAGIALGLPAWPSVDFAKFGPVETQAMSRIKKISGPALHRNWVYIPHITQQDEADITELEAFRKGLSEEAKKQGVKLTPLAFIMKAVVAALQKHPEFNSSLAPERRCADPEALFPYRRCGRHTRRFGRTGDPRCRQKGIGAARKRTRGHQRQGARRQAFPCRHAGRNVSRSPVSAESAEVISRRLSMRRKSPSSACRASVIKPLWNGKEFQPRLMLPLSLSYDHRVVDGAQGARFISALVAVLSDIRRALL